MEKEAEIYPHGLGIAECGMKNPEDRIQNPE
jgi:hypothetical protein